MTVNGKRVKELRIKPERVREFIKWIEKQVVDIIKEV